MKSPGSLDLRRFFLAAALLLLVCQPAFAEKRVALVLGNSAYQNVARLANPVNDGAMIAATLKNAGFDVVRSVTISRPPRPVARCATSPTARAMPTSPWSITPATASRSTVRII
jgi:hypothetical protein